MGDAQPSDEKSRRPDDTDFKQQRLKAWQPILTPNWVIGTFAIVGLIFIPIGSVLKNESDSIIEHRYQYDGEGTPDVACKGVDPSTCTTDPCPDQVQTCDVSFNIPDEMKSPVYVYYQLDNFYQNHRRYVKSRSDKQLRGEDVTSADLEDCAPLKDVTVPGETASRELTPCGLIANSLFNDTISLTTAPTGVTMLESSIAWSSDIEKKFANENEDACQAACTQAVCDAAVAEGGADLRATVAFQPCVAGCPWSDTKRYGFEVYPSIIPKYPYDPAAPFSCNNGAQYGVTNEHFVVWMRTAGLPNFRKLYGKIEPASGKIEAGSTLTFTVDASFPVTAFGGKKFLVISTTSWFGGKNPFLGIAYITVGALCLCLSLLFLIKHKMSPRKLGDTRYLVWKNR